jgi:hypothetical protein
MARRLRVRRVLALLVVAGTTGGCGDGPPGKTQRPDAALEDRPSVPGPDGRDAPAEQHLDTGEGPSDAEPPPAGEVIDTIVGQFDTFRTQVADIVPLGNAEFVVGYRDARDRLQVVRWDTAGRQGSAEAVAEGVRWLRADTSDGFSVADPACPRAGGVRINTLAVEYGGAAPSVRLDVHANCDGRMTMTTVPIAAGVRPSTVTVPGSGATPARTLVVYGRTSQLFGRMVTHVAHPDQPPVTGEEFPIARFSLGGAFSTDVIHNRHSNRYIVGFVQKGGFACSIWNVVLDPDVDPPVVVNGPTQVGGCDGDQGGHHTSVAYNPLGDGHYAWWRQDMKLVKSVFIHDAFGAATSPTGLGTADVVQFGNIWTAPVAHTKSAAVPYVAMFGQPAVHLFDMDAAGVWVDRVPRFGPSVQVAVRAFPATVVGLVRSLDAPELGTTTLRLLQVPFPLAP